MFRGGYFPAERAGCLKETTIGGDDETLSGSKSSPDLERGRQLFVVAQKTALPGGECREVLMKSIVECGGLDVVVRRLWRFVDWGLFPFGAISEKG